MGEDSMATYSDQMIGYADFYSTGRFFALAAAASALIGGSLIYASSGHLQGLAHTSADFGFAATAGCVLLGLSLLMTVAALGSLLITNRAKRTITVTQLGVLNKAPGEELFLAREEILGMTEIPRNPMPRGTLLVTADSAGRLLIPSWIDGYAACLEEIQKLGVPALPPYRRTRAQSVAGWLSLFAAFCGTVLVLQYARPPFDGLHQWRGLGGLALVWVAAIFFAMQRCSIRFDGARRRK
jgi:hypothetical protein